MSDVKRESAPDATDFGDRLRRLRGRFEELRGRL